jgi:hypothetical protein
MPATRWLVTLGCAGLLLVACGQEAAGGQPVIGVRPPTEVIGGPATFDASSIALEFASQLTEIDKVQSMGDDPGAYGLLPIDSTLTFKQSQRLLYRQQQGDSEVASRLRAIATVRSQVFADRLMSYYQKASLIGTLDTAIATLDQMRVTIAREQLPDQIRNDVDKVYKLRIGTVVLPRTRMIIAADLLVQLAAIYANQQASLQQQIYTAQAYGKDVTAAQAAVNDLAGRISAINGYRQAALYQLQGLDPAGYPANKYLLRGARGSLVAGKSAGDQAAVDVARARAALGR